MKQYIEQIIGQEITEEQYKAIRSFYDVQQGMYILTVNDKQNNMRKGTRIETNNWLDIQDHLKLNYPEGYIEGYSVMVD